MKGRGRRRRNQAFARPRSSQEEPWPGTGGRGGASGEEPAASGGGSAPSSSGPPSSGSPPFGGRRGSAGGGYSELDLIVLRAVSEGRELTGVEERHVREGVAAVGFIPGGTQKVTATLAGVED